MLNETGHAGAALSPINPASVNEPNSSALCFRSQNDALNFARDCAKEGNRRLASYSLDWPERYEKGEIEFVFNIGVGADHGEYDLVFFRIPPGSFDGEVASPPNEHFVYVHPTANSGSDGNNQPMLVRVGNPVQGPDRVIPTFVRLEGAKQREDIRWDIFAPAASNHIGFKLGGGIGDGEISVLEVSPSGCGSGCISGLVQGSSKIAGNIKGDVLELERERLDKLNFMKLIDSLFITLNDTGVWFSVKEDFDFYVEIINVFLCVRDTALGTIE
jgi:hypothetical protein